MEEDDGGFRSRGGTISHLVSRDMVAGVKSQSPRMVSMAGAVVSRVVF